MYGFTKEEGHEYTETIYTYVRCLLPPRRMGEERKLVEECVYLCERWEEHQPKVGRERKKESDKERKR